MNSHSIFLILFIVFSQSLQAQVIADASLWLHEKYSGKSCGEITNDDLYAVDQITDSKSMQCKAPTVASRSIKDLNSAIETIFFDRMAKKQLDETNCEISSVGLFEKDDSLIRIRSDEIANKLPFIKEQTELANRAYFDYRQTADQNNVFAANCRNTNGDVRKQCFGELEKRRYSEKEAETRWHQRRGLVTATIGSLWNGTTQAMNEFILKLLKYDPQPSNEIIFNALKKRIPKVKAELEENKVELLKQSTGSAQNIKFNNLSDETKRKLVEEAIGDGGILSEAVNKKDDSAIKFMCRLEGKYTKGRDSLNRTVGTATLLIGGAAGLVSKIPLAVRAGQLANILSKAKSSAVVIGALATGVDAGIAASAILNKCFSESVSYSVKNSCPANQNELKESEIKRLDQNNCILEAAISVAPAGILASSKALKTFFSKIENRKLPSRELEQISPVTPEPDIGSPKIQRPKPSKTPPKNTFADPAPGEPIILTGPGGYPQKVTALKYDVEMAKASGLTVPEVVALRKNFADTIPTTGETGVFRLGDDLILNGKTNLVGAYTAMTKKLNSGAPLTGKDILEIREKTYEFRSVGNGKDIIDIPTKMKGKYSTVIDGEIPPYVQERLKHYQVDFKIENGKTKINYPDMDKSPFLDQYAAEINRMIDQGYPAERIAAFAAQDLLILHPFKDGNGRTARVIAQALYKKLTGKDVVFHDLMKSEMEVDVDELARSIAGMQHSRHEVKSTQQLVENAYRGNREALPTTMDIAKVQSGAPRKDEPFPKTFKGVDGKPVEYSTLGKDLTTYDQTVFYGRLGGSSLETAESEVEKIFKYGRGSRDPNPHLDLNKHAKSTRVSDSGPSGFFPTSTNYDTAAHFARQTDLNPAVATPAQLERMLTDKNRFGVVFAIDPKGAEVLNLYKMDTLKPGEGEVLFGSRLSPSRFEVAVIIDNKTGEIVKVIRNPGYVRGQAK